MNQNYFLSRRSCRNFSPEKISPEVLENIIEKAMKAPTTGNMQLYSVIVTQEKDNRRKLANYHYNQPASLSAPIILTICADFNRFTQWCETNNADAGFNNLHSFMMACTDAVILAQQITTVAELEGLGTCYLGTVTYNAKEISELLKLPELVVPVVSLALGYPKEEGEETKRLPLDAIIHYELYSAPCDDNLKKLYSIIEEDPKNEKFIKENNKDNIAQVFSEVRYPREINESISAKLVSLLKEKGFNGDRS